MLKWNYFFYHFKLLCTSVIKWLVLPAQHETAGFQTLKSAQTLQSRGWVTKTQHLIKLSYTITITESLGINTEESS